MEYVLYITCLLMFYILIDYIYVFIRFRKSIKEFNPTHLSLVSTQLDKLIQQNIKPNDSLKELLEVKHNTNEYRNIHQYH